MRHEPFAPKLRPLYHAWKHLWENREALDKYLVRLKELMEPGESLPLKENDMSFAPGWRGTNTIAQENEQRMAGSGIGKPANQQKGPEWPRRADMSQMHPAELAILAAMQEVEKVGASTGLTNAILKLQEAKNSVSDFIDGEETHSS